VLAVVGVSFAYFAILPAMFSYFTNYSESRPPRSPSA